MKRICLLAAYDPQNIIDDYVLYLVKALSQFADVYYFADNNLPAQELAKLEGIAHYAKGRKHGSYDFGSWAEIIRDIGYQKLAEYDELLLVNDAAFGPIVPLDKMFAKMTEQNTDAWAMAGNKFMMSFFVCLSRKVFTHSDFKHFFDNIKAEGDKSVIIKKYEQGLNRIMTKNNFSTAVYISDKSTKEFYQKNKAMIKQQIKAVVPFWARLFVDLGPGKIRLYEDGFVLPLIMQMPVLKKVSLLMYNTILGGYYPYFISQNTNYPVELISNYFKRVHACPPTPFTALKSRLKVGIKSFFYRKKYKRDKLITYICKIPLWYKKMNYDL